MAGAERSLSGAVIAVIGASGGLGREIRRLLDDRRAIVIGVGRSGGDVTADLRDPTAADAIVEYARSHHGRLDGVINAAGIVAFGDLADTDDIVIEELFLTNVIGPMWMMRRVVPVLAETNGFVVNISAVVAETPMPGMAAYSASKAALAAAAPALRREVRRQGVTIIDVRPPHTETGLAERPLAGTAPRLATGLEPARVAERIISAIERGETDVASTAFD